MFNFSWSEIALLVVVSLIFIGPKDLPVAMRTLSKAIRSIRRMAGEFQQHIDEMVKDADLSETRDQLNELRQFNFRDQVRRVVDPKDDIRNHVETDYHSAEENSSISLSPGEIENNSEVSDTPYNARMKARAEALESAPAFLPPTTALRLIEESSYWKRPSILPPEIALHQRKRVPILREFVSSAESPQDDQAVEAEKKEEEHGRI